MKTYLLTHRRDEIKQIIRKNHWFQPETALAQRYFPVIKEQETARLCDFFRNHVLPCIFHPIVLI